MRRRGLVGLLLVGAVLLATATARGESPLPEPGLLTIERCLELGLQNSEQLKVADHQLAIARQRMAEAKAGFWPTIQYLLAYNQVSKGDGDYTPKGPGPEKTYSGSLTLTQPIYTGGKLEAAYEIARRQVEMAEENIRQVKQKLTYSIKEAYYQVCLAEETLQVSENAYNNLHRHYQLVEKRYQAGTASKFELLRAHVQWENLKPQVIRAKNGVNLAKLNLATLIGLEDTVEFSVDLVGKSFKIDRAEDFSKETLLAAALENRPEMRQMKLNALVAQTQTKLTEAWYKPNIATTLTLQNKGSFDPDKHNPVWKINLGLSGLLYDSGQAKAKIKAAQENEGLVVAQTRNLADLLNLEVDQVLKKLEENREVILANQANITLAEEALKLTEIRFQSGMATTMDVIDAQLALDQALNGYYGGVYAYLTTLAQLDLAIGKDFD